MITKKNKNSKKEFYINLGELTTKKAMKYIEEIQQDIILNKKKKKKNSINYTYLENAYTSSSANTVTSVTMDLYKQDGFQKLCDVKDGCNYKGYNKKFFYKNIDHNLMYSDHRSWVYMIVNDAEIVKIGETGQPLGITKRGDDQPMTGTKSRMGRLANAIGALGTDGIQRFDTDQHIRESLLQGSNTDKISIWVKKCDYSYTDITIAGEKTGICSKMHKDLEKKYLDHYYNLNSSYPYLNSGRA